MSELNERVLVLMPTAKDGERTARLLTAAAVGCAVCDSLAHLCREIAAGAGTALLTEEAVTADRDGCLTVALKDQPPWSDFPLVVLAREGRDGHHLRETMNATLVERPIKVRSLLSVVRAALRARRHQYEVRDHLAERARQTQALRASEERLRRMVNVDGVGVLVWSLPDGRLLSANDHFFRMFGYTQADVDAGGLTWRTLTPPEYVAASEAQLAGFAATGRIGPYEKEYFRKDGSRAWMVFAGASLGDGTVVEYCIDVGDRKRAEEALREADRRKDEFIALLAHELRNPLAPIRNGLQVLKLSGAGDRTVDMMDRQLTHLVRLVDDLLDVSRITRNKLELRRERVTLAEVVSSAVETAQPVIDGAGHELTVTLPDGPVYLDADLTRLAQVFSNLLTNAAKYTPQGGRIGLTATPGEGSVSVTVQDTGIGIPPAALPNIFDMFSQVDRSIERTTGGLGIGLALVKGLTEMHGGTVTAVSAGRGSAFTVTLPVLRARTGTPAEVPPVAKNGTPHRILVVDDNRDGAESLSMLLGILGHEVQTAYDGVDAVEKAERFRPDVVLMDIGMPRMNGYEATRRIRNHAWGANMTIIALTGWGQEGDRKLSQEAGCNAHLVKPVSLPDLARQLEELSTVR